jgi:putative hydrolase of the HAD superfamily
MLRALIFDLDDTLYPERDYIRSGFRAVGEWAERRLNLSQVIVGAELQALFDGGFQRDAFQWWLSEKSLPDSLLTEMVEAYRSQTPRIAFYPEVESLLDELRSKYRLGLLTEGRRAAQQAKVRALGLDRWMEAIVILGENDRADWKPSRTPFDRILEMLSVAARQAAYVGDNPRKDFRGAREVGMLTVRIRREGGLHAGEEPASAEDAPDREIRTLEGLLRISAQTAIGE